MGILDTPGVTAGKAPRIAFPRTRAVMLGDSFWEKCGGPRLMPTGLVSWDSGGPIVWMNYFLKQSLRIVKNAGVGGQQVSAFLARVPADVDAYDPDWVLGTGGINDITQGRTEAQLIADFTALFNYLINVRGYRVTWNTINTVATGWATAQYKIQATVNQWLRAAPSIWPNLIVIDAFAAVYNVSASGIPATYRVDATHLGPAGAIRTGRAMADALAPHLAKAAILESGNGGAGSPNLISNGRFANPASGVASGWTRTGGVGDVLSQVARTDEPEGFWQRMEIAAGGSCSIQIANVALDPTKVTPGTDSIRFAVEVNATGLEAAPATKSQRFNARMQIFDAASALLADHSGAYTDGGYDSLLFSPGNGVLATADVPIPATATKVTVSLSAAGGGRFEWDKATLVKAV